MSLDVSLYATEVHRCEKCGHESRVSSGGEVYTANVTHNLNRMAKAAGIYMPLWRPDESDPPIRYARDLIAPLEAGLERLRGDREYFEQFNAPNGWGLYKHFVPFVEDYIAACEEHPDAEVRVSR